MKASQLGKRYFFMSVVHQIVTPQYGFRLTNVGSFIVFQRKCTTVTSLPNPGLVGSSSSF